MPVRKIAPSSTFVTAPRYHWNPFHFKGMDHCRTADEIIKANQLTIITYQYKSLNKKEDLDVLLQIVVEQSCAFPSPNVESVPTSSESGKQRDWWGF
jgi:hypothetical protein